MCGFHPITPNQVFTDMPFDPNTIKPYLESSTIRGALTSVIGAVLGVAVGGGAVALADDVYSIVLGGTALAASGVSFYGSVVALIGRFKANSKVG